MKQFSFLFQSNILLTSKDKEVRRTDTSPFRIKVSERSLDKGILLTAVHLIFRSSIKSIQKALIGGDFIAKGGNLNVSSSDEFVGIVFDDDVADVSFNDSVGDVVQCSVPHRMHVDVMYTR